MWSAASVEDGLELLGWLGPPGQADATWERAEMAMYRGLMPSATEG